MNDAGWAKLVTDVSADRERIQRRESFMIWSLLAQDGMHTLFGKPFSVRIAWPDGLPLGMHSDDELRTYAREQLDKLKEQ